MGSAGRPSRWALAHILVTIILHNLYCSERYIFCIHNQSECASLNLHTTGAWRFSLDLADSVTQNCYITWFAYSCDTYTSVCVCQVVAERENRLIYPIYMLDMLVYSLFFVSAFVYVCVCFILFFYSFLHVYVVKKNKTIVYKTYTNVVSGAVVQRVERWTCNRSRAQILLEAAMRNNLGQVVHTLCASATKQCNLVGLPAKGRWCSVAGEVTAGLAESNGSVPPGGWLTVTCVLSASCRLHRDQLRAQRSVSCMGQPLPFLFTCMFVFLSYGPRVMN